MFVNILMLTNKTLL